MGLSIIVPVLNEAAIIGSTLLCLQPMRMRGVEVIVVDGGSKDDSVALARPLCDRVLTSGPGRARQMNTGAASAHGEILWFLHADTLVPEKADIFLKDGLKGGQKCWGRFDVRLSGNIPLLKVVSFMMNWRSRLSGIATGDQGIFVVRRVFEELGGFADIPLMEDIEISKRLKKIAFPLCLKYSLLTSSRRWQTRGVLRTILLMWRLRLAYALGVSPQKLADIYR